ncbi:MAG: phosphonoacetaldehyde hydrolase [Bryobacteraceae bacterium]|nr:phosphonoacetaldehyde hydrolase [Bryobacteraceae bacterium]
MKLRAAIFDWAGTTVDYGCFAPVRVLEEVFAAAGVPITAAEARASMGLAKHDHIRSIVREPRVAEAWRKKHGVAPGDAEAVRLYEHFVPLQSARVAGDSAVIPGAAAVVARLRDRGLRIGSSTGYTRAMLDLVLPGAAAAGYAPDTSVTPEEAGGGRPAPWMLFENLRRLGVYPPRACVKIGDTVSDMEEGVNAGMWTVGVVDSGNEIGLTPAGFAALSEAERAAVRAPAAERLRAAGADFIVQDLSELEAVLEQL